MAMGVRGILMKAFLSRAKHRLGAQNLKQFSATLNNGNCYSAYATQHFFDAGQPTAETHPQLVAAGEITPGITEQEYLARRKKLLELLPEKSLVIMASAPVKMMTDVVPYPFRQDADYLYFTGCQQPGGIAVLSDEFGLCMFMPDSDPEEEIWRGQVAGTYAALNTFKADQTFSISKLHMALLQTMLASKRCPHEHILATTIEYECKIRGAQRMAFPPVVGGGANGSVIHYSRNDQQIKDGEMVLMDVGCEVNGYVSDLTRTWPPCGSFSPCQRELYELILDTANECLKLCKPGVSLCQIHSYSVQLLSKGLAELGILKNSPGMLQSYWKLNPTSIGHYLGMDVHDCSSIKNDRLLQPGVVITIEPGVYIPVSSNAPERFRGIGIRIEDEVLITDSGHEVLTASVPREIKQIESLLC